MYDYNKPDLFVHPYYYDIIKNNFNLHVLFNICSLDDVHTEPIVAKYITDDKVEHVNVDLDPYYTDKMSYESGSEPSCTSYWFQKSIPMYRITNTSPRYVIWTKSHHLSICATRVDRVHSYQLYLAAQRAREWAYTIDDAKSIIVFDLDDTLIGGDNEPLSGSHELLRQARRLYDYVVLWSHGSALHVDEHIQHFDKTIFDLILRNDGAAVNKNLLYLYNYFRNCRFVRATLIDDSVSNWTPEYSEMIIPARGIKSVHRALAFL